MTPDPDLYLDHLQGGGADEPPGRPSLRTLADIYAFDPIPRNMPAGIAVHVLGAEAALWTEHMRTEARVEHAAFPRLDALAEVLWSPAAARDWSRFVESVVHESDRQRALGIEPAESAFEVRVVDENGTIALSNQAGFAMRYTIDGGDPVASSPLYASPVELRLDSSLRAATFLGADRVGPVAIHARTRDAALVRTDHELAQCTGGLVLRLEDDAPREGPRAVFDVDLFDPCWLWQRAPLDGIAGIEVRVGEIPYNFELAGDAKNVVPRPKPATPGGELLVVLDGCKGREIARIPLAPALANPALTTLEASWPPFEGAHDLCFEFAAEGHDPLWTIDRVRLVPGAR
jgi:hexosaminidase